MQKFITRAADEAANFILRRVGFDGLLHFTVSMLTCALLRNLMPWHAAALATLAIGLAKELIDMRKEGGRFSAKDLICDIAGALLAGI